MTSALTSYGAAERYSGKALDYARYRPAYPPGVMTALLRACAAGRDVADFGAGTGIFTRQLLGAGFRVHAVEPNDEMRAVAEAQLTGFPGFRAVGARAEATALTGGAFDAVTCAQSFHWFDAARVVTEMRRVLRPRGVVALLWNEQRFGADAFHVAYERLLSARCPDYGRFALGDVAFSADGLRRTFDATEVAEHRFENAQTMDREGFQGLLASVSYCPPAGTPERDALMEGAARLFDEHAAQGKVTILYDTTLYLLRP